MKEVETAHRSGTEPSSAGEPKAVERIVNPGDLIRIFCVAVAAVVVWLLTQLTAIPTGPLAGFGAVVVAIGGWPILREAAANLRGRRMTMELSMTLALVAALAIGQVFVTLVITAFVLAAEVLEELTVTRGRRAIADLLQYLPRTALVRRGSDDQEIPTELLSVGDLVLINPGAGVPVDGVVVRGASHIDESTITGEPMPVEKTAGDRVYAGTLNQAGALEVRAQQLGRDSTFGRIIEAVERAEQSRAPVQKTADRLAGYLVYFALAAAAITFFLTRDLRATISVVIVAGACGVAAGTPLAILGAIGRAARHGSIIKGGIYLERLWAVDTVVLDKTGTLTFGTPGVQEVLTANGSSPTAVLEAAAVAEARSEHPLGRAILAHTRASGGIVLEPQDFSYSPGHGVVAHHEGSEFVAGSRAFLGERGISTANAAPAGHASEVMVAKDGDLLGSILLADTLRPEAADAVRALRALGLKTLLLTGDNARAAEALALHLGVDDFQGGMLPAQKQERVHALVASGHVVAMVGDGVNDASALVVASVGVAMGSGTEVTRETANVVLIGNDLSKFVETLQISRRTRRTIMQNFAGTLTVDMVGMALAALGMLGPLLAALVHVSSELAFILNSARLLPNPNLRQRTKEADPAPRP